MAKGKKAGRSGTRDAVQSLTSGLRSFPRTSLLTIDDRRTFDFEPATRPARLFDGSTATISATPVAKKSNKARARVPYQIAFNAPKNVLVCVRRRRRREVLFAKKKTGKGGQRRPRRTQWSSTTCR